MCYDCCFELLNFPSKLLKSKTPFELLYSHPPSLSHLRVLGFLTYASPTTSYDKFNVRVVRGVFMGYSSTQKEYKIYDLHFKSFVVSKNVIFHELVLHEKSFGSFLFPVLDLSCLDSNTPVQSPNFNVADPTFLLHLSDLSSPPLHSLNPHHHLLLLSKIHPSDILLHG